MKKKLQFLFSMVALFLVAMSMQAQTDVTATYVKNADLSADVTATDNGWTCAWRQDYQQATDAEHVNVVEFYAGWGGLDKTEFSLSQEIELPAGNYRIAVNAFYREGDGAGDGTNKDKAYIFAGDKKQNVFPLTSLSAFKEGGIGGSGDLQKASNAFYLGEFSNAFDFAMTEAGTIEIGFAGKFTQARSWVILGPVKLYKYTIDDYKNDYVNNHVPRANAIASSKMNGGAAADLSDAIIDIDALTEIQDVIDAIRTLDEAISAAEQSVILYDKVKKALEDYALMVTNLDAAGQAAYDVSSIQNAYDEGTFDTDQTPAIALAYANAVKAQTTAGTDMTGVIANAAGNAAVGADNWQLTNDLAADEKFQLDTWAGTASGMSTPMIEYWHAAGTNLSSNVISQTITGLTPGTYKVTATTAVNNEQNVALTPGSAILFANDGETDITEVIEDVSTATSFSGTTGTFEVEGVVAEDGELTIGFKTVEPNYNWFAFKDVKLTLVEAAPKVIEGYDLTADMYHKWTSPEADAEIANPDNPGRGVRLNEETDCPYGNTNVVGDEYADLTDWDQLIMVLGSADQPRLFFNDSETNGGRITVLTNDANYVVSNVDGVITYDLTKIKEARGFVHLNAIKASSWNTKANVTALKLIGAPKYDITIDAGIENGTVAVKNGLKNAAEGAEVTLIATPGVTYELEAFSVTYNDGSEDKEVEVSAEGVFTMPAFPVTVSATFVESATPIKPDAWFVEDNFRVIDYKGKEDGPRIEKDGDGKDIRMIPRFELEDKTTGNGSIVVTTGNNAGEDYWSQFWFKVSDEPMTTASTPLALTFRIRADRAQTIATQGHGVGWDYNTASNGYLGFDKIDVTTEWKKVVLKVEAGNGHPENFVSVVLNLSEKGGTSNNFYIDDVKVEEGFKADWYYAQEIRAKDYYKENIEDPDPTYTDTDTPHPLARFVADEEGGYVQVVSNANPSQPYNSQIWIQIPDEWVGKTTKMTFEVMADQVVSAPESYQATATGKGWGANAAPSATAKLEITEADKWITIERILNTEGVKSNGGAPYPSRQVDQYCVDLSNNAEPITYKFKNIKFEVAQEDWYANNVIVYKDPDFKDSETGSYYEDGKTYEFPAAPYNFGAGDERGGYVEVKSKATPANAWASQIFFSIPSSLVGKAVNITMDVKASQEVTADGQLHNSNDGGGYTNAAAPKMPFTTEWATQTVKVEPTTQNTYVLNLAYADDPITYYFDNLAFELAPVNYQEPNLEDTEQWYQDLAAQGITILSHEEPAYTDGTPNKNARYIKGEGAEGDYLEYVAKSGVSATWESQVFIYLVDNTETTLPAGTEINVSMKVKASENHKAGTQAQQGPGGYLGGGIPEISFTTEWQPYNGSFTVPASGNSAKTNCFSLDLGNTGSSTITYYFDEVVVTVTAPTLEEDLDWTDNLLKNGNFEGDDMSEFVAKIQLGHNETVDGQPTGNYIYEEMDPEILEAEKTNLGNNAVISEEPNGLFLKVAKYAPDPADETKQKGNSWDSQLWIRLPYTLPAGTYYVFDFDYKTSNSAYAIETQTHGDPGNYINSDAMGKVTPEGTGWEHFHFFGKTTADLSSICLNLASENGGNYRFDNFSLKVQPTDLEGADATIPAATETFNETSLWLSHTKPLNEKIHEGKEYNNDEGQYSEESFKALTDAIAAAKAVLADNDKKNDKDALATALTDVQNAIDGLEAPETFIPMPELTEDYEAIPMSQDAFAGFTTAATSEGEYEGDAFTTYTASGQIEGAFKMQNIDVTDCDKIYIYFAKPLPAGWDIAFWGVEGPEGVKSIPAGTEVLEFDLTETLSQGGTEHSATKEEGGKTILKEITMLTLWGASEFPLEANVYGVYKHKVAAQPEIADLDADMYHLWTGLDAEAEIADPDTHSGVYVLGSEIACVYGNTNINIGTSTQYADLSDWDYLTIVVASTDQPRLFFNQNDQQDSGGNIIVMANNTDYIISNENGVIVYDLAKFKADYGYVHLNAIKASAYNTVTNVTEMKLANGEPYKPVVTAINTVAEDNDATVKDGKYFINGQIVIVKNGVKYNTAGVAIE